MDTFLWGGPQSMWPLSTMPPVLMVKPAPVTLRRLAAEAAFPPQLPHPCSCAAAHILLWPKARLLEQNTLPLYNPASFENL